MCGIVGFVARDGMAVADGQALVSRMVATLTHRGPDGCGQHVDQFCGVGCTRLAIVDVLHGAMPVSNEDGRIVAALNGEIYNYRAVRRRLLARGHRLLNQSDSEVIPHLYEEAGADMVGELTGMFAFAVWDGGRRRLLLARDRFGIKPLLIARLPGVLLFASEAKALLASGRVERHIDPRALMDLGTAGYPMPPRTMFKGVESLLPGTWRVFEVGGVETTRQYFTVPYPHRDTANAPPRTDPVDELRTVFDTVVRDHLMGDVPVAALVSGGIDSVSVAARASTVGAAPMTTFSMTFGGDDAGFDESRYSDLACRAIESIHHRVPQLAVDDADYRGTIRALEAPQMSTIPFCLYRLARAVRDAGIKVVLTGEGADEVFAGYRTFKRAQSRRGDARAGEATGEFDGDPEWRAVVDSWWREASAVESRYGLVPPAGERWWAFADTWYQALAADGEGVGPRDPIDRLPERPPALACEQLKDPLHRDLLFEQRTRLDGWVLSMGDRVTMANSVEARVPFLDHRLVELSARVPSTLLLHGSREKHLLKEAMAGRIPDAVQARTKQAFNAPIDSWLFGHRSPEFVDEALAPDSLRRVGIFDRDGIARLRRWLAAGGSGFRRATAGWALNLAVGLQIFAEEFDAAL